MCMSPEWERQNKKHNKTLTADMVLYMDNKDKESAGYALSHSRLMSGLRLRFTVTSALTRAGWFSPIRGLATCNFNVRTLSISSFYGTVVKGIHLQQSLVNCFWPLVLKLIKATQPNGVQNDASATSLNISLALCDAFELLHRSCCDTMGVYCKCACLVRLKFVERLEISGQKGFFRPILVSCELDLWPPDPKIWPFHATAP